MVDSFSTLTKLRFWKCNPFCKRQLRAYREACGIWGYEPLIVEHYDYYVCELRVENRQDLHDMIRYCCSRF